MQRQLCITSYKWTRVPSNGCLGRQNSKSCYCWAHCHMVWSTPSNNLGQLSWLCFLSTSYPLLTYSLVGHRVRNREDLDAVQKLFSTGQNTGLLSTLLWSQIQSTAPYGLLWTKLTPSHPVPVQQQIGDCVSDRITSVRKPVAGGFYFFIFVISSKQ